MFFLGNITAFAQTNPYIEQIDSVVDSNGNYIETYTYDSNGGMRLIRSYFDNPDGLNSVVYVEDDAHQLIYKYQYSQDAIGILYMSGRESYVYDSEGRLINKNIYLSEKKRLYLSRSIKYEYSDNSSTPNVNYMETYSPDQAILETSVTDYDKLGRETTVIIRKRDVENDIDLPGEYITYIYMDDDDDIIKIERIQKGLSKEYVFEKVYYTDGRIYTSEIFGDPASNAPFNDTKYDRYGVMISDSCYTDKTMLVDKVFGDDGKLKEAVRVSTTPEQKYIAKYSYDYFLTDEGLEYYSCTTSSYEGPDEWKTDNTVLYVPEKVEDGVYGSFHAYEGGEVKCQFFEKGALVMEVCLKKTGSEMIVCSKDVYTRDKDGDVTLVESFAIPSSDAGDGALQLTKRTVYQFDESVPVSAINGYRYYDWKKKILSMSFETPEGEEYFRQNYYYTSLITSDIKPHTASSSRQSGVYDVNGHLINAPKAGKIYIQNSKKFVAK